MTSFEKRTVPTRREGQTIKYKIGDLEGYAVCNVNDDGDLIELFIYQAKGGSTLHGWADAFAIAFSGMLQFASSPRQALEWLCVKLIGQRFEPHGSTGDPDMPQARSVVDYIGRQLALLFLNDEERQRVFTTIQEPVAQL